MEKMPARAYGESQEVGVSCKVEVKTGYLYKL